MSEWLQDPMHVYVIAFVVFLALAFRYGRKPALDWVDGEIAQIRTELDSARALRAEAEAALADCKAKQARAEADAKSIIANAQQQVDAMRAKAEADLASALTRQSQLAAERIRMAEADAVADVRSAAIDAAMKIARDKLSAGLSDTDAAKLVDQAIADIPALKTASPKAA